MINYFYILLFCTALWAGNSDVFKNTDNTPVKTKKTTTKKIGEEILSIRILAQTKAISVLINPQVGKYQVTVDGHSFIELDNQTVLKVTLVNDSIELRTEGKLITKCKFFRLTSFDETKSFKLKTIQPERKPRFFDDNLSVSIKDGYLLFLNNTYIDHYIAGVSEAEAGSRSTVEFYKVQAILARTYALAHINKHVNDGYNLCDQVHCQAFYGKSTDTEILEAVALTKGQVVVDENLQLISAVFHSNSGGETVNSEDLWGTKTTYLRAVHDTFSCKMPNAKWERKMLAEDWLTYLKLKHNYPIEDSAYKSAALHFTQESRKVYFEFAEYKIPLKTIRTDLQLKSTYFTMYPTHRGDTVIFKGKGFGHGIGMCQEGAMRMTKLGYSYKAVLNFYYQNIYVINLRELNFFKE